MDKTQTIIPDNEIESKFHELPVLQLGIHDQSIRDNSDTSYQRIPNKPSSESDESVFDLKESTEQHSHDEYMADIESANKQYADRIKELDDPNLTATDSYIHDVLKRGVPSGNTIHHIHKVIDGLNPYYQKHTLAEKWGHVFDKHAAHVPTEHNYRELPLNETEVAKLGDDLKPIAGKIVASPSHNAFYEMHNDKLNYIGSGGKASNGQLPSSRAFIGDIDQNTQRLKALFEKHYSDYPHPRITSYTEESNSLNRYLHKLHKGDEMTDSSHVFGREVPILRDMKNDLSTHIKNVPPKVMPESFHVYTGMYQESRPDMPTHLDEHGHFLFHNPSFTSTSLDKTTAIDFARLKHVKDVHVGLHDVMKIKLPGGYPRGMYIQPHSFHQHENEYLLDAGHTFKVHPVPKYYIHDSKLIREWQATVHHDTHPDKKFEELDNQTKVLRMLDHNASTEDLDKGSVDENTSVRAAAAKHPKLGIHHMERLMNDDVSVVRRLAKSNPSLPHALMDKALENDDSSNSGLAVNPNILEHHKEKLAKSGFESVQSAFASRSDLEPHHLSNLIEHGGIATHTMLASNPHTPKELLKEYVNHPDSRVRQALAGNPNAPHSAVKQLVGDTSALVRTTAKSHPKNYLYNDVYANMEDKAE